MLQVGSLAGLGLSLDMLLRAQATAASSNRTAMVEETNCILIWTRGGTSHHDTLDPKPDAKAEVRGEFDVISTAVPGIQFTDQMPHFAKALPDFAVMRNLNPRNAGHAMAEAIMMSGKPLNPSVTYPCFGSVVSKEKGQRGKMPPFIQVGSHVDRKFGGGLAGFLGITYDPFELPGNPNGKDFKVRDIMLPDAVSFARVDRRRQALNAIDAFGRNLEKRSDVLQAMDAYYQNAFSMITSPDTQKAFELEVEPSPSCP